MRFGMEVAKFFGLEGYTQCISLAQQVVYTEPADCRNECESVALQILRAPSFYRFRMFLPLFSAP
jgi:hypothetical protein